MKKHILFAILSVSSAAIALAACSGDDTNGGTGGGSDAGADHTNGTDGAVGQDSGGDSSPGTDAGDSGPGFPAPPALGATQIDRMGRPAINTALNHTFDTNTTTKNAAKDTYNNDKNPAAWIASYTPEFAKNLAIYDALDTTCGNQAGYDATKHYAPLAGLLAGDMLWLNTAATATGGVPDCKRYLGVELNALGALNNTDCGGRTLTEDVIDETYSLVATGGLSGVTDGINGPASPPTTTFPYLAAPH